MPNLSDLKGSGGIEEDADIVIAYYRPDYYEIYKDEEGNCLKGLMKHIILKHRGGALGTIKSFFYAEYGIVDEWIKKPLGYTNATHAAQSIQHEQEEPDWDDPAYSKLPD